MYTVGLKGTDSKRFQQKMKLFIALTTSIASYAAEIRFSEHSFCRNNSNCILKLRTIQLEDGRFVEIGGERVVNYEEESEFCSKYGLSVFSEVPSSVHHEKNHNHAGYYPICIADSYDQNDYKINWETTGKIGCFNNSNKCDDIDAICCSAYHGQNKNKDCSLGAQRATLQSKYSHHRGHFCVKPILISPTQDSNVIIDESTTPQSPVDESNHIERQAYTCAGFSRCLPNPYTHQPEGNIFCTVTYNDLTTALSDCRAFNCSHLLQYQFNGSSKLSYQFLISFFWFIFVAYCYPIAIFMNLLSSLRTFERK